MTLHGADTSVVVTSETLSLVLLSPATALFRIFIDSMKAAINLLAETTTLTMVNFRTTSPAIIYRRCR
jgi:hypothetical protein